MYSTTPPATRSCQLHEYEYSNILEHLAVLLLYSEHDQYHQASLIQNFNIYTPPYTQLIVLKVHRINGIEKEA